MSDEPNPSTTTSSAEEAGVASADALRDNGQPEAPLPDPDPELQRLRDQLLRTAADYDNFRKRSRRETEDAVRRAREDLLRDLLPVFDNLERAAQHAEKATDIKSLTEGISMVLRLFLDGLSRLGIERIQAVGQPFDPAQHEAVQQLETIDHPPGTVVAEVLPGYRVGERLVRPAIVVVAKPPPN